jgi:predicted Zn-dependent peptidase
LEQVHVVLGFQGVPYKHPDYYPLALLSSILGGGMSSRLFQEIREKRGLVYTIYAFHAPYRDNGIFGIYAGTSQEKANELIDAVGKELKTFVDSSIETELNRSKAQLKASLMMSLESTSSRSEQMASQMHIYGKLIKPQEILKKIEAITANDIKEATARILTTPITSTLLGPVNGLYSYEEICKKFR